MAVRLPPKLVLSYPDLFYSVDPISSSTVLFKIERRLGI